jgi:hypothetical protein
MPITPFLGDISFDPETKRAMKRILAPGRFRTIQVCLKDLLFARW